MKKVLMLAFILFLTACGSSENKSTAQESVPELPEVEIMAGKEPLPVKEEIIIQASVTQGGEPVTDASYVEFEIWNKADDQEQSQKIKATHTENGIYEIAYSFDSGGIYQLIAHTQVDDLHTMPKIELTVGDEHPPAPEKDEHHHEIAGKFMVHMNNDEVFHVNQDAPLVAHINRMEQPFENAMVRFEISSETTEKHIFVHAKETTAGEYTATHTFTKPGTYTINVHYEKPDKDIHGHKPVQIEVK